MATARAFGSITIIDVTDIGEFSVYPMSNLPLSVIYSPDENTYSPSWSTNNLILTPVVYYSGQRLTLGSNGLSITWQKMEGISSASMSASEVVGNTGILTVSANQFTASSSLITYTVNASYVEPTSGTTLNAQGQITFSLVKMASEARNVTINGDNIFKYDMNGTCNKQSTTLTAFATDTLTISDWEYSNNGGTSWTSLNNSSSSLTIQEGSSIFSNNTVLVRVKAQDIADSTSYYYDYITVLKLRDGTAAGNSLVLSNEDQMIPCNSSGTPTQNAFSLAYTAVYIYESGQDITSEYTITATPNGVLGAWTSSNSQAPTGTGNITTKGSYTYYWVTGWANSNNSEVGEVTFTATKGTEVLTKKMSLVKISTGADGVSPVMYSLDLSSLTTNKSYTYQSGTNTIATTTYSPTSITATAKQTTGNTTTAYAGYIKVYADSESSPMASGTATGGTYTLNGIGTTYVPSTKLRFELYTGSGSSDTLLDTQSVIVTSDGVKGVQGVQGNDGNDAVSLNITNPSDNISVGADRKTRAQVTLTVPFSAYEGTTKMACTITAANAAISINGTTYTPVVTAATSSSDGSLVYTIPINTTLLASGVDSANGSKTLTFTYTLASGGTGTISGVYSWAITKAGTDGANGVNSKILQVSTPQGYIFDNGEGTLQIVANLINGGSIQSTGVTYQWYKFNPSSSNPDKYDALSNAANAYSGVTTNTLTVYGTQVDSYASFRCTATYDDNPYVGYASLEDKTDPIQVSVISTVGTQIVNGNGVGCFYARVIKNDGLGTELDPLPTGVSFVTAKPSTLVNNAYYYLLNSTNKTVTLYKATSTSNWAVDNTYESANYHGTYTWTYRNSNNEVITNSAQTPTPASTGKIVYIDSDLINKKIIIDVEVVI